MPSRHLRAAPLRFNFHLERSSREAATPSQLTSDLLEKPAAYSVRVIATSRLEEARAGYERYLAGEKDGLHELRVALRRLRSWLRAFEPEVQDTLRKKTRRRLSAVAKATNGARDVEVAAQWIASQHGVSRRGVAGRDHVLARLAAERRGTSRTIRVGLARDLPGLLDDLARQTEPHARHEQGGAEMTSAYHAALRTHATRLVQALARVKSREDVAAAHRARIAAKRLRYLLECGDENPRVAAVATGVEALQDTLGIVHDTRAIAERLVCEIADRAAADARQGARDHLGLTCPATDDGASMDSIRPGLIELAERARESERDAFANVRRRWGPRGAKSIVLALATIAKST